MEFEIQANTALSRRIQEHTGRVMQTDNSGSIQLARLSTGPKESIRMEKIRRDNPKGSLGTREDSLPILEQKTSYLR